MLEHPHQHELRERFPGAPGGLALAHTYGSTHMARIGAQGGAQTLQRYGQAYLSDLARRGALERWRRARLPRTVTYMHAGDVIAIYRRVAYRPATSRRRKPMQVLITLWESECCS